MVNRLISACAVFGVVVAMSLAALAQAPATKPSGALGDVQVRTLAPATFFYTDRETTLAKIADTVKEAMDAMTKAAVENKVQIEGAPVLVYHGASEDPTKPFKLEVGMIVAEGTKEAAQFKVRKIEAFKCAGALYTGPMSDLSKAYGQLFPKVFQGGNQPTDEMREYYLYWEGQDSANNVVWLQVGVE